MTRKEWQAITSARDLLGLGSNATRAEIQKAFRHLSKKHHPDAPDSTKDESKMVELTGAYELLMRYCDTYRFPLQPGEKDIYDAEDWWMERFGQDPHWGKGRGKD